MQEWKQYRIAGNFCWVQIFVIFADRPASTQKKNKWRLMMSLCAYTSIRTSARVNEMVLYSMSAL